MPNTYIYKVMWRSTAKLIKVVDTKEEKAYDRAAKRKDIEGCLEVKLHEVRKGRW